MRFPITPASATVLGLLAMLWLTSCADRRHQGYWYLRWIEAPGTSPSTLSARPEDRVKFVPVCSWDDDAQPPGGLTTAIAQLREGDVIAYRMNEWEAEKAILTGKLNTIGYRLYAYGHLGMVVQDAQRGPELRMFSSQSFTGPNTDEDLSSLEHHRWDAFRLDQWPRIDRDRLHEFVRVAKAKGGHWDGYDFAGMFALRNSRLDPEQPQDVGRDYICSTTVLAAYHYAGVSLDAAYRAGVIPHPGDQHHGMGDLVTPKQVVASEGHIRPLPEGRYEAVQDGR